METARKGLSPHVELDLEPHGSIAVECVVNGPIETNTYFVLSGSEALVIDPAWEGEKLARDFERTHPDVRIVGMACTHGHGDHVGGVAGMRRVLGPDVPFAISQADADSLQGAVRDMRTSWNIDIEMPPAPDRILSEDDTLEVGDAVLQVFDAPGHTPGGIVLFAATNKGDIAFVGDTLFPGGHGRTDLPGGHEADIMRSLARLGTSLPSDTLCYIGHGTTTTIGHELASNPFMAFALRHKR